MKTFSNYLLNSQYIIILLSKSFLNDEITDEDTAATPKRISVCALLGHRQFMTSAAAKLPSYAQ